MYIFCSPAPFPLFSATMSHCFLTIPSLSMTSPYFVLFHKSFPNFSDAFMNLKNKKQSRYNWVSLFTFPSYATFIHVHLPHFPHHHLLLPLRLLNPHPLDVLSLKPATDPLARQPGPRRNKRLPHLTPRSNGCPPDIKPRPPPHLDPHPPSPSAPFPCLPRAILSSAPSCPLHPT